MAIRKGGTSSPIEEKTVRAFDSYQQTFKAQESKPVATRLTPEQLEALRGYAIQEKRRVSAILNEWILERMKNEGIL